MNFKDPKKAWDTVYSMVEAAGPRARNRARINSLFNGDPPFTDEEAQANSIYTNVNFLEGTEIMHKARGQFTNAFLKPGKFFTVKVDMGPVWKRQEWGQTITTHMNRAMKRSPRYFQCLQDQFAGVVLHGVGPVTWFRDRDWCPKAHGIDDVFMPSGTLRDLSNLNYFAIYTTYTMAELLKATTGDNVDKGWNKPLVQRALTWLVEQCGKPGVADYDSYHHPEKLEEDFKENSGYWSSDATPVLKCYDFYWFNEDKKKPGWRRMTLLDQHNQQIDGAAADKDVKLFDGGDRNYGDDVGEIIHCQYADGAVKPPFRYHSVRSLGYLLYALCHLQNRIRCKFNDAVFESMLWYFRSVTDGDEERLAKVDLHHLGIIPEGLSWVPGNERHTVEPDLIGMAMTLNRQLMSEHSSHYVQDVEKANQNSEQTATEVMAKVNNANAMIGSMLAEAYTYEQYKQQQIAKRFCTIKHKDAVRVRQLCMMEGVPPEVFKVFEAWDITTERTLGGGNKTLEIAQSDRLMAIKDTAEISPDARRKIVRVFIAANTDDPILANDLVPNDDNQPSPAGQMATLAWGTLIDAKPVIVADPVNPIDYIQTLMQLLDQDLQRIEQAGGSPPMDRIMGLANVIQHLMERIQIIAVDQNLKPLVKQFLDALKNAGNLIKGYLQRAQEAMAKQDQQGDPEAAAKIQAMLVGAEAKSRIMEDNAAQKRRHLEMKFVQDQTRKNDAAKADIQRKLIQTASDIQMDKTKAKVDIALDREKTEAEIDANEKRTEADIEAQDASTKASIVRENVAAANKPKPNPKAPAKPKKK
jgi:hypothetical protein